MCPVTAPSALRQHPVFVGRDLDRAWEVVSGVINPHSIRVRGDRAQLDVRHYASNVGAVTLTYLAYGTEVEIAAPDEASCFCVQLPLSGSAVVHCGDETLVSSASLASVPSPCEPLRMVWSADAAQLIIRIDQRTIERHLQQLAPGALDEPIRTKLGLDMRGWAGRQWTALLDLLEADIARVAEAGGASPVHRAGSAAIEELVLNAFLLWHPNNQWARLSGRERPAGAPYVRRAVEYIDAHLRDPLTVGLLANVAGVSVRALQAGFARDFGRSPSAFVRERRLDAAHAELLAGHPADGVTVTDVALRFGFSHLGRFSQVYLERFGELPSVTLRGARP